MVESPSGAALIVAGYALSEPASEAALVATLGELGDRFAADGRWRVARLTPGGDADHVPELANIERELVSLGERGTDVAIVVIVGRVTHADGAPALVANLEGSGTGGALRLTTIGALARASGATCVAIVLAGSTDRGSGPADMEQLEHTWLAALATGRPGDLVAVAAGRYAVAMIESLRDGLAGTALDPRTGTVTLRSLGEHLKRGHPGLALQSSALADTVLTPPLLSELDDPRLIRRPARTPGTPPASDADPAALIGNILPGQFRIDAVIGRGAFGTVYRACQLRVGRDVAIKVLHVDVDPASPAVRLFVQEIRSVGQIDHPNVVRIYQADLMHDGQLFFAMELLTGGDLEPLTAQSRRVPLARALAIADQLLAGLEAAHQAGVIHADLKPANVLIAPAGDPPRVVLVDFGLSRLRSSSQPEQSVGGTPAYMAPEQLRGGKVDARSDLFSAALVLIALLTGWRRHSADALVPPLRDIRRRALRRVLQRALALDPEQRFATAAEFRRALLASARRRSRVVTLLAAAAALVVAIAVATTATRPNCREVFIGGSGTVLFGFLQPVRPFIEERSGCTVPIESKFDLGSGGAIRSLRSGEIEVAALSTRFDQALPSDLRSAGKVMVEIPVGYDETALFVHRDNPLRELDLEAIQRHLCCGHDQRFAATNWAELGVSTRPLADQGVGWTLFGRTEPPLRNDTTSSTVLQADDWLCAPRQLCPTLRTVEVEANDVLAQLVTTADVLALSTRAFSTDRVVALRVVDRQHHTHLDGRKLLWLYLALAGARPIPEDLCRLLDAVLDPRLAQQLAAQHRAQGLPDALRIRQRVALGLEDGSCRTSPLATRAAERELVTGILRSPIANDLAIQHRWAAD
jgi:protein kinase-like protein/periplasmic binding family protein